MTRTRRILAAVAFLVGVLLGASVCGAGPVPGHPPALRAGDPAIG